MGTFIESTMGSEGRSFVSEPHPVLRRLNTTWDVGQFNAGGNTPFVIGVMPFRRYGGPPVLDMPVKMPGSAEFRVPGEFAALVDDLIRRVAGFDATINARHVDQYAYLTVDNRPVVAGSTQRNPGWHVDGFQGHRIRPKLPVDHSYLTCDTLPPLFHPGAIDVSHLDEEFDDFFRHFDATIGETPEGITTVGPCEVALIDPYVIHRGAVARRATPRVFVRLTFAARRFDRLGNTHNPMFDYDWEMVARDFKGRTETRKGGRG